MLNFNGADPQKETGGGKGLIPPKSYVKVRMTIRAPGEAKKSNLDPMLTISASNNNNHFADCEFEVVAGTYEGLKIWQNYVVAGAEKASQISMSFLRGVLESARGIQPTDSSPQATAARQVNAWSDFNGVEFVALVGVKKPAVGDQYINNDMMRAVTPDKPEYQQVMSGGEIISDNPIPEIPQASAPAGQQPQSGWGQGGQSNQQPSGQGTPSQQPLPGTEGKQPGNMPAWAQQ